MFFRYALVGMAIGVAVEVFAATFRLWRFRHRWMVAANVVLLYGLLMGALGTLVRPLGPWTVAALGALAGLVGELLNLQFLRWWDFPDGRSDSEFGRAAMVVLISVMWGVMPLGIVSAERSVARTGWFGPQPTREQVLAEKERLLRERRADLERRLRDVESRLLEVQRRRGLPLPPARVEAPGERRREREEEQP